MSSSGITSMFSHFLCVKMWMQFIPAAGLLTGYPLLISVRLPFSWPSPSLIFLVHFLQPDAFFPVIPCLSASDFSVSCKLFHSLLSKCLCLSVWAAWGCCCSWAEMLCHSLNRAVWVLCIVKSSLPILKTGDCSFESTQLEVMLLLNCLSGSVEHRCCTPCSETQQLRSDGKKDTSAACSG